jgi:putative ABC transport system ATP-binding protein
MAVTNHSAVTTADPITCSPPKTKPERPERRDDVRASLSCDTGTTNPEKLVPAFVARGLSKIYQMGDVQVHALRSVDLELYDGELVVLLGASGSGKSTLLNILGGLDVPTSGEVFYRDHNLTIDDDTKLTRYRREHVGFVFQFYNLIPSLTALENVELVTDIATNPMRPEEALELVGLGDRMNHFPSQLSGGEQQRVAIARAVAKRPEVLLCDEPTGALDYATGKLVLEAIERVNRELGTTTAIITHNAAIADMGDRVLTMRSGEIAEVRCNEKKAAPADLVW